jgi:heme-degrading monooxygenase HmoA
MVQEIALIEIKSGSEQRFEEGVAQARPYFLGAAGCHGMTLWKTVERASEYKLVVEWETVEDHTVTFRQSDAFQTWRSLVQEFFASPPLVVHQRQIPLP